MQVNGTDVPSVLDTGAVPNHISAELVKHRNLMKATWKTITEVDGSNSNFVGRLGNVPIAFGHLTLHLDFPIMKNTPSV